MDDPERNPSPAPAPQRPSPPGEPAPRRHRVRRWLIRLLVVALIVLALAVIAIQAVLWTGMPKSMVVSRVEQGLGLHLSVKSLSTGWLGHTSLSGVKISLPLARQAFLDVPSMKVNHTNLIALLLGYPVEIHGIQLDKPVLYVRQDSSGRWNLQQVSELIARTAGKKTGQETARTSQTPTLPWINIRDLTIVVLDNKDRGTKVEPVNVSGQPEGGVSYKYDVEIPSGRSNLPPHLSVLGRVAPGGTWAHEAHVWVHDIAGWVRPWKPGFDVPITFDGDWQGDVPAAGVEGFLEIKNSQYASYHAKGALSAWKQSDGFGVKPRNLQISGVGPDMQVSLPTGEILFLDGNLIRATRLQLALLGGPATINGWYQRDIRQGALEAVWQDLTIPGPQIKHSGKLNFTFSRPTSAPMSITALLNVSAQWSQGPFDAVLKMDATGNTLSDLQWNFTAPTLAWHRPQPVILDGLSGGGTYEQTAKSRLFRLDRIALPQGNRVAGNAWYDFKQMDGEVHIQGQDWPIHLVQGTSLGFAIDAKEYGVEPKPQYAKINPHPVVVELDRFFLRTAGAELSIFGNYNGREPKPVSATVNFQNFPGSDAREGQPGIIRGTLVGQAKLAGTLSPTQIDITGHLDGSDASILGRPVGDLHTAVVGSIDSEKATLRADGIPFLDGIWNLGATYVTVQGGKPVYATTVDVGVQHLPLPRVSAFLKARPVQGMFAGQWYVYFPGLKPEAGKVRVTGSAAVENLAVSYLAADQATFKTSLQDGRLDIAPITLRKGNYGRIDAHAALNLIEWRQITAGANLAAWPLDLPGEVVLQAWGGADPIQITLPDAGAQAPDARKLRVTTNANLRASVALRQQPEGEVRVLASMQGRSVDLRSVHGNIFGGTVQGDGVTDLDHPFQSRFSLAWSKLQAARAVQLYPQLKGLAGTFGGRLRLGPATTPRPLEPLALDVSITSNEAHWRTVRIGDGELHAFVGTNHLIGSDTQRSILHLADGTVDLWLSMRRHPDVQITPRDQRVLTGYTQWIQMNFGLDNLDVDQFVQAFDPDHAPGLGRLGGSFTLLSAPHEKDVVQLATVSTKVPAGPGAAGAAAKAAAAQQQSLLQYLLATTSLDGKVTLDKSNLAQFGPIAVLFNAMHLGADVRQPTGTGSVALHMEQGRLQVKDLHYFNRGIEVRGLADLEQMWLFPANPIQGTVVGTARPLKSIRLPLIHEADAILAALQGQLTTIQFQGTLNGAKTYQILSLKEMGTQLRNMILGEVGGGG